MKLKATSIGGVTMVGYFSRDFPIPGGNCFDLGVKNKVNGWKWYRIINFGYENFEELLKRKIIQFPVEIESLDDSKGKAILTDERIPKDWYRERYCSVCYPEEIVAIIKNP